MIKGYKFRIYPTQEQQVLLAKTFGCCRFVWNYCLAKSIEEYEAWKIDPSLSKPAVSGYGLANLLPQLKQEFEWLSEVSSAALQQQLLNLGSAFSGFFKLGKGYPNFKKKQSIQYFRLPKAYFRLSGRELYIAKSKIPLKVKWSRLLPSIPSSIVVSQDSFGRYFVSFNCECVPKLTYGQTSVGIDLGLTHFATLSTGEKIDNPRYYIQLQRKLGKNQRQLSRKQKGSSNRNKARIKVAKIHARIKDQRADFIHKLTTRLVSENQAIAMESLQVKNMVKLRSLSKHISDVGWGMFKEKMIQKVAESQWCNLILADRFFPSSHLCSSCYIKLDRKLFLGERFWTCSCGATHDRDINAAKVIEQVGAITNAKTKHRGIILLADTFNVLTAAGHFPH